MKINEKISVKFHHDQQRRQSATIIEVDEKVFTGIAKCSPNDHFCKLSGRRISLTRALQIAKDSLTKDERTLVWDTLRINGTTI